MATNSDLIDAFAAFQAMRGFSPRTIARRTWTLGHFTRTLDVDLAAATVDHIEQYLGTIPTLQSRYSLRSDLKMFYAWAVRRQRLNYDPTSDTDPPRVPRRTPTPLTVDELERSLDTTDARLARMIAIAAFAGLRVSEIAALHTDDIHPDHLTVRHGKGGHDRTVPLHRRLIEHLADLAPGLAVGTTGSNVSDRIRSHFRRLGITRRPHDLRATFATNAYLACRDLRLVANLMGHSSITTTERYVLVRDDTATVIHNMYPPARSAA